MGKGGFVFGVLGILLDVILRFIFISDALEHFHFNAFF
jgi:hypothetical protein